MLKQKTFFDTIQQNDNWTDNFQLFELSFELPF